MWLRDGMAVYTRGSFDSVLYTKCVDRILLGPCFSIGLVGVQFPGMELPMMQERLLLLIAFKMGHTGARRAQPAARQTILGTCASIQNIYRRFVIVVPGI